MSIFIAEWDVPGMFHRIEVSKPDTFLTEVKKLNREYRVRRPSKVRALGGGRIPADIQRLIDKTDDKPEPDTPGGAIAEAVTTPEEREEVQKNREEAAAEYDKRIGAAAPDGSPLQEVLKKEQENARKESTEKPVRRAVRRRPGGAL